MRQIRFRFDPEKLVAALAFFASRGVPDLDVMKTLKLLYFADKTHLLRYGRPIIGDDYYGMEHGPVPSNAYDIIKDAIANRNVPPQDLVERYIEVQAVGDLHQITAKQPPNMDVFSDSDVEVLEETIRRYGQVKALELRRLAHEEPDVKHADAERAKTHRLRADMPYRLFFSAADEKMLAVVEEDQDTDRFAESLTW